MKIFNVKTLGLAVATSAILMGATTTAFAGDPVPGIDVSLEQIPGGKILHSVTDAHGKFGFAGLKSGSYAIHLGSAGLQPARVKNYNSSRSNVSQRLGSSRPPSVLVKNYNSSRSNISQRVIKGGVTEFSVTLEMSRSRSNGSEHYIVFDVGQGGGAIVGSVSMRSVRQKAIVR